MKGANIDLARKAKEKAVETFVSIVGKHVSVGIVRLDDGYGLKVNLLSPTEKELPENIDEVPVQVEVVGKIKKR